MSIVDLSGQAALVTGGSRGVGAATAKLLARAGADVSITYKAREDAARVVRDEVEALGRRAASIRADVSQREDCERAVAQTVNTFGRLDIFIANAGIWPSDDTPVRAMGDARWRETLEVNLDSVFFGCRAALAAIETGAIVIVTSTAGQRGEAYHADYAATKGAIISFVKSLAVEAAPAVNVNGVAPGWILTEMSAVPYARDGGKGKVEIAESIPLQRIATTEDVAGPIVFLCSPLARHVTGEIVNVNGGAVLCG